MNPLRAALEMSLIPPERVGFDVVNGVGVSTVLTADLGWETAVADVDRDDVSWHPVQRYPDEDAAVVGHAKWVALVTNSDRVLVTDLGYPGHQDSYRVVTT